MTEIRINPVTASDAEIAAAIEELEAEQRMRAEADARYWRNRASVVAALTITKRVKEH